MQELRFVAVSEDGSYAVLAVPGRSGRYILPIDERLRAVALGQTSRLAQYEIEVESPLRPKEIQARIRAGETAEEIADAAGIPVERVRWFEGPVLAERAYIATQAQTGSVRRAGDAAGPGPRLGEIVTERLSAAGTDPAEGQWDSRKRGDGNWQVSLTFPSGGRLHVAEWVFDPRRRHVMPDDDNAARLSLPESELPAEPVPVPGEATVTPIASRLGAAAGMGGGSVSGFPATSRFRPDKSVIPDRSLGVDRSLVERPAAMTDRAAGGLSDRAATPPSAAPRSGPQDRAPHPGRSGHPGYAEFPESAPYRASEPPASAEPAAHRDGRGYDDPASATGAYRSPAPEPAVREPVPAAGHRAPATDVSFAESERGPVTPPRPVVFEDPEPTPLDEQPEPAAEPATELPAAAATPEAAKVTAATQPEVSEPEPSAPAAEPSAVAAESEVSAPVAESVPVAAAEPAAAPGTQTAATADPETTAPAAGAAAPPEPPAQPESAAPAEPAPTAEPEPAAASSQPEDSEPKAEVPAPAEPTSAEESAARRSGKKNAKARRSSVPSWDEIMLGSSRQRD